LRERTLGGVDKQEDGVNGKKASLHLSTEVGVPWGVDDNNANPLKVDGGLLGEDRDPLLALQVATIHDTFNELFIGPECAVLSKQAVDQGGLAMVDVRDDTNRANTGLRDETCGWACCGHCEILARFADPYTLGMTVAAHITVSGAPTAPGAARPELSRLVEAAWSGGAHPILVSGLTSGEVAPTLSRVTPSAAFAAVAADAIGEVAGTTAVLTLPLSHAGVDPETITALIAAHGRKGDQVLVAARHGKAGPIRLTPVEHADASEVLVECGDEGAVSPSDGRSSLAYEAPPADTDAVDPWEQRGSQAEER
jgi:hypothetical protein